MMFDALISKGMHRGYVSYDEIDALFPDDPPSEPAANEVFAELARADIRVRQAPEALAVTPTPIPDDAEQPVNIYSREVSRILHPTPGRELALGRAIRAGGPDRESAKKELVEGYLYLVIPLAQLYPDKSLHLLDLIQNGNLGLMKAAEAFDPERGYAFSTYATWWVRRAMRHTPKTLING